MHGTNVVLLPITVKALWVGGPAPSSFNSIKRILARARIEVIDQWAADNQGRVGQSIPKAADIVLINSELCSHKVTEQVKAAAIAANKPIVYASNSASKTIQNIMRAATSRLADRLGVDLMPEPTDAPAPTPVIAQPTQPVNQTEPETNMATKRKIDPRSTTIDNIDVFEEVVEGEVIVYVRSPRGESGIKRRSRPVGVGDALFLSAVEASEFLEFGPTAVAQALSKVKTGSSVQMKGFDVWYTSFDQTISMLPSVVAKSAPAPAPTPVETPKVAAPMVEPEVMQPEPVVTMRAGGVERLALPPAPTISLSDIRRLSQLADEYEKYRSVFPPATARIMSGQVSFRCEDGSVAYCDLNNEDAKAVCDFLLERKKSELRAAGVEV